MGRWNSAWCGRYGAAQNASMNIPLVHAMLCNSQRRYTSCYETHYFELHIPKTAFISQPIASVLQCRKLVLWVILSSVPRRYIGCTYISCLGRNTNTTPKCNPSPLAKVVLLNTVVIKQLLCSSWEAAILQQWETRLPHSQQRLWPCSKVQWCPSEAGLGQRGAVLVTQGKLPKGATYFWQKYD